MNKTNQILTLGAALLLAPLTSTFAQSSWTTVDDFTVGTMTRARSLAAVGNGGVFSAGNGTDLTGAKHAFVRRSLDGGQTWLQTLDLAASLEATVWAITVGGHSGLVFATATLSGTNRDGSLKNDWVTLRSADGGTSWSKVDVITPPSWKANPYAVVEDPAGRVFVGGYVGDASNAEHFLIRRSLDGGTTWKTVDDVAPKGLTRVTGLAATSKGVFATGWLNSVWSVRRSTDGGTTWKTVDTLQPTMSHPAGIAAAANGDLYVTGQAIFLVNKVTDVHWFTSKSSDGGATWRTVDDTFSGTASGYGQAVTVDTFGRVFAAGSYTSGTGSHWVTRASLDGGATWTTTDDFVGAAHGAASDAVGNVYIGGGAVGVTNPSAQVRKLATQ